MGEWLIISCFICGMILLLFACKRELWFTKETCEININLESPFVCIFKIISSWDGYMSNCACVAILAS